MDDPQQLADEMLALESIYDNEVFSASSDGDSPGGQFSAHIDLPKPFYIKIHNEENLQTDDCGGEKTSNFKLHQVHHLPPIMLNFQLPSNYPSIAPPCFTISAKWLTQRQISKVCLKLDEIWKENQGFVVLFLWTDFLLQDLLNFLDLKTPLDISHIVPPKCRGSLHTTSSNESDSSHNVLGKILSHECKPSDSARNQTPSGTDNNIVAASLIQDGRLSTNVKHSIISDQNHETNNYRAESDPCTGKIEEEHIDPRAIQDIASQEHLLPTILDHDKSQRVRIFNHTMFACLVCLNDKMGEQCISFAGCSHVFCKDCMREYFRVQIGDGSVKALTCPNEKCDSQAHPAQVKELVDESLFSRYDRLLLQSSLDLMTDIMYCPRRACGNAVIVDQDMSMGSCCNCTYVFCIFCRLAYHGVSACRIKGDEVRKLRDAWMSANEAEKVLMERRYGRAAMRQVVEDSFSEEWLEEYSKKCPSCGTHIQKIDGCNKMSCSKCHTFFCWLCMVVLPRNNPYSHFSNQQSPCFNLLFQGIATGEEAEDDDWLEFV